MKTLFIGNSHTYKNDLPRRFAALCARGGTQMDVTMLAQPGVGLDFHAAQPQTRFNILYGGYDIVVLQHTAHPMGDPDVMEAAADQLAAMVQQAGAKLCLFMTWAARDNQNGQPEMTAVYTRLAQKYGAYLAPVGLRWWDELRRNPAAGLFAADGQHAAPAGSDLAARVIYETLRPALNGGRSV